jgi:membrane protease YdiL (CAAX protease family)
VLIAGVKLSPDAAPFTQYANFDKASVGLILLAFFCNRARTVSEWKETLRRACPVVVVTSASIIVIAILAGYVKPDFKISSITLVFLAANLLFTCVAEEAFFRGFLQSRIAKSLHRFRFGSLATIICSGMLFGIAHAAGGFYYVMLATLAGFGYAYAYAVTRRIEASILTHFALNAVHFVGFTYPHLQ